MTKVVHCKKEKFDIYIGRPSKWGNQFVIGMEYQGRILTRNDVIEAYKDWLLYSDKGLELLKDIHELKGKVLGCWCRPYHPCHGDLLAELADRNDKEE